MVNSSATGMGTSIASIWKPYALRQNNSGTPSAITATTTSATSADPSTIAANALQGPQSAFQQMSSQMQSLLLQMQNTSDAQSTSVSKTQQKPAASNSGQTSAESTPDDSLQALAGQFAQSLAGGLQTNGSLSGASSNSPSSALSALGLG